MDRLWAVIAWAREVPPWVADGALALFVAGIDVAMVLSGECQCDQSTAVQMGIAIGVALPLTLRRRFPFAVQLAVVATATGAIALDAPTGYIAFIVSTYTVGSAGTALKRWAGLAAALARMAFADIWYGDLSLGAVPSDLTLGIFPWVLGMLHFTHTKAFEREREERAQLAAVQERSRIARELHDVVAHAVSVMVVQTSAARHVLRRDPERADDALARVEDTGRDSLAELRRLLGVLRTEDEAASLAPQPRLAELDDLLGRFRGAGMPIELVVEGEPRALPAGLDLSAFRIVQEALTNALKHAGPAGATVNLRYGEDTLDVEIVNAGADRRPTWAPNGGRGLAGMRERATLLGGRLTVGPDALGNFRVRCILPLGSRP